MFQIPTFPIKQKHRNNRKSSVKIPRFGILASLYCISILRSSLDGSPLGEKHGIFGEFWGDEVMLGVWCDQVG